MTCDYGRNRFYISIYVRTKKKETCYIVTSVEMLDLTNGHEMRQPKNRLRESHDNSSWQMYFVNVMLIWIQICIVILFILTTNTQLNAPCWITVSRETDQGLQVGAGFSQPLLPTTTRTFSHSNQSPSCSEGVRMHELYFDRDRGVFSDTIPVTVWRDSVNSRNKERYQVPNRSSNSRHYAYPIRFKLKYGYFKRMRTFLRRFLAVTWQRPSHTGQATG